MSSGIQLSRMDSDVKIQESSQTEGNEPSSLLTLKSILRIIIAGIIVNTLLTIASFIVLNNRQNYSGPLSKYLPIHSGEFHYARLPQQYWEHRIKMLKAMGLNTLSVYVMWNYHEREKNSFDFQNGNKNITLFLELAKRNQMQILLRPGPYVCAQWDFGGLPARLLGIQGMEIRSANKKYEEQVKIYFTSLAPFIKPYLSSVGGPIIMIQIQNELGYIRNTPQHTLNLISIWKQLGINSEFYYEDPGELWLNNYWEGAHIGLSQSSDIMKYLNIELSSKRSKNSLIFGGEIYSGWFTDWGTAWAKTSPSQFSNKIDNIISHNRSVNLYMGFGGTNFAMTAGANGFNPLYSYMAHITSYDYDSPVTEKGTSTEKYLMLLQVFQKYYGQENKIMDIPVPLKTIRIQSIAVQASANLFANLGEPIVAKGELTYFESDILKMYNQGLVLYSTILPQSLLYSFSCVVRDYALVFIDDILVTTMQRGYKQKFTFQVECKRAPCTLKILVEAMGHINFGKYQGNDRKGLFDFTDKNKISPSYKWDIYKIQLSESILNNWINKTQTLPFPVLYKGSFNLSQTGDTFLDMRQWGKGYVWINKQNLGRYWNIGPQYRLYCPGVWLKQGKNEISILELSSKFGHIQGFQTMQ